MSLWRTPASIRARLVLLVLAVWLPAVAGLALQARDSYLREERALRDDLHDQAEALQHAVQAELDRRQSLARVLAASPALRGSDLPAFEAQARAALRGTPDSALLVDRTWQYLYTALPSGTPVQRRPGSVFVEQGTGISVLVRGPSSNRPAVAVLVPDAFHQPPRYNVGIPFPPPDITALVQRQRYPQGSIVTVVDAQKQVVGRSRDIERWFGTPISHPALRSLAATGQAGFVQTTTLDGVPSLTYLTAPGPHGWRSLVALPLATLRGTAWQLALQAVAVSAVLLAIGLAVAIWAARRVSGSVHALEDAAAQLLARRVPAPLRTDVAEVDRVGAVLHDAGLRAQEASQLLEQRVAQAVRDTRAAEASLFDARKHEAIGRLTGGLAHDFNNLLQTISMGLQVVQRAGPDGRLARPVQSALAACSKAAELVRQMLAFGRAQPLQPRPLDLADLLLSSRELTGKALGERIRLVAEIAPALPPVLADPTQLELALLNLVFNARDAMPGGGTVTVAARAVQGGDEGLDDVPMVRVDVRDDGQGMDAQTMARVFEPYFTTKPVGAGTGLGLPQVQAFARQSGGGVRLTSALGRGTCVSLLLPAAQGPADAGTAQPVHMRRSQRSLRVLMVEDDVLVASVVPAALEYEGHRVMLCRTADEACALLRGGHVADVLFTDVVMPGSMTGLELVEWCRTHQPKLPALVATGYSARAPQDVWKVLRKPYAIEDLLDALDVAALAQEPA